MPSSTPITVRVLTVSYKTAALAIKCLVSIEAERKNLADKQVDVRVTVVDNASGDAASISEHVATNGWDDWVNVLEAPRNGGFAYGNNYGFKRSWETNDVPDYFFLLNPDTEIRSGAIEQLVGFLEAAPGAAGAASRLEDQAGKPWPYAFRFPNLIGQLVTTLGVGPIFRLFPKHTVLDPMTGPEPSAVDWFPGAAMILRSAIIREHGGMDEAYFLYFEETDFCLKLKRAGHKLFHVPSSRVMHISGQSTGVTGADSAGKRLPAYWFESRRRYFIKNHGVPFAATLDLATLLCGTVSRAIHAVRPGRALPSHYLRDLARHGAFWPKNQRLEAAREFRPQAP